MARLEPTHLASVEIPMDLVGAVPVPEPSFDPSPTGSVDSAIGDSPRQTSGNSGKYLSYGGPGFSIAGFDGVTGTVDRIPVPLPLSCAEIAEIVAFPQAPVTCLSVVGETQVWVGSQAGSLHVFELGRNLRFASHSITMLDSSVLCIASRHSSGGTIPMSNADTSLQSALRIDILLGSTNGAVTIISGEASPNGGLSSPSVSLRKPRKVLDLTMKHDLASRETEEGGNEEREGKVNCIAAVHMSGERGGGTFWCSCGRTIVAIRRDGWEEIARLDAGVGHLESRQTAPKDSEIVLLFSSEHGVWSALSHTPTISLWDSNTMAPKLSISCCSLCDSNNLSASDMLQITALHFTYPYLFVGTSMGDLMVFRIKKSYASHRKHSWDYRVLTAEHCGPVPILDIFASSLRPSDDSVESQSPFRSSAATPTSLQVIVVCGPRFEAVSAASAKSTEVSSSTVLFYDLLTSPTPSPLASPLHLATPTLSRPSSSYDRRCSSVASNSSATSSSSTLRRRSLLGLYDGSGALPKLSLHSASPFANSLLPLRTS